MIIEDLKTVLTGAGCTKTVYESIQMANTQLDGIKPNDILGVILEPEFITLSTKGNGITRKYPPITIQVLKQVSPEDTAENNETTLEALLVICETIIFNVIRSGEYMRTGDDITAQKVYENRYDANLMGWTMDINLAKLQNQLNC